jgi:hypothetical protein
MQTKSFSLQDFSLKKARKLVVNRNRPWWDRVSLMLASYAFLAIFLVGVLGLGRDLLSDHNTISLIGVTYTVMLWLAIFMLYRQSNEQDRHPLYSGPVTAVFAQDSVTFRSREASQTISWSGITDLTKTETGFLLRVRGNGFIPLPFAAFEDSAAEATFVAAIHTALSAQEPVL